MKLWAIIEETFREARAKKTLIGFFIFSTLLILVALLVFQSNAVQSNVHKLASDALKGNATKRAQSAEFLTATVLDYAWMVVAGILFFMTVCVGIFATAGLITSIMEKGTIDLLLSKPVARWLHICGRYLGSILIILLEVAYFVFGVWVMAGISFGMWNTHFLWSIAFISLGFAGIYSVVVLIGVLTRSSWFAIILGVTLYFITGVIIPLGRAIDKLINGSETAGVFTTVADIVHWCVPQLNDLTQNMSKAIVGSAVDLTPVFVTAGLSIVYLSLASFAFSRKEF